jgi:N-acetylmuramoyl-L-alanine amidase
MRLIASLSLALISGLAWAQAPVRVDNVRLWAAPDYTRVVFDLSGPVEHRVSLLKDPARLLVEIPNARGGVNLESLEGKGLVQSLKAAPGEAQSLRVLIQSAGGADIRPKSFLLKPAEQYGHRLVVDLYPPQAAAEAVKSVKQLDTTGQRDVVVAVDAGHGGDDPGARGRNGAWEKDITLAIARKLAAHINRQPGMKAVLVRDGDYYLGLRSRMAAAREHKADMFLSIHADAFHDSRVRGSSVYILSDRGASSEAAKWLADKENASDLVGGVSLEDKDQMLASVLLDLSQNYTLESSAYLAKHLLGEMSDVGKVHRHYVERASFMVLKSPDIPSVLVETAFISNPDEEKRLQDPAHQEKLARSMRDGILSYLNRYPPPGTRFAKRNQTVASGDGTPGLP